MGQRSTTAVPTQALFLMNSSEVKRHAEKLARQVSRDASAPLHKLWLCVLNRPPTANETTQAQAFLTDDTSWVELCRGLLATNEFLMTL